MERSEEEQDMEPGSTENMGSFNCQEQGCGASFNSQEELQEHNEQAHGGKM